MEDRLLLGIKQVTKDVFDSTSSEDKVGYIWFVRTDGSDVREIYLGSRKYADISGAALEAGSGITIDGTLINANSDATTISEITLTNGSPVSATGIWDGDKIPAGTSIQSILEKLLGNEIFPSAPTKPNFTINGAVNNIIDKGVKEYLSNFTLETPGVSKTNGTFKASFTDPSQPAVSGVSWTDVSSSMTIVSGFTDTATASTKVVEVGNNFAKYEFKKKYSEPSNMPITNLSHSTKSRSKIYTGEASVLNENDRATWIEAEVTKSANVKVVGAYRCFSNISGTTLTENPNIKATLTSGSIITLEKVPSEVVADKHLKFAYPKGKTVEFKIKDLQGNFVPFAGTYEENDVENFYNGMDYVILETTGGYQGENDYQFVFDSSLSTKIVINE